MRDGTGGWYRELEVAGLDEIVLGRAAALAGSLTSTTYLFADVLEGAYKDLKGLTDRDTEWAERISRNVEGRSPVNHVSVALKAWLFDVRALHDALGDVLSMIVGQTNRTSMFKRLSRSGNQVASAINAVTPGYEAWFLETRETRNRLKDGDRYVAINWDAGGVTTLNLFAFTAEGEFRMTTKETLHITRSLADALGWSSELMVLAVRKRRDER